MTLFTLGNRFSSKLISNLAEHIHIIIVTGPPTVPGRELNPGPLSFEASALLTELTRPALPVATCSHILELTVLKFTYYGVSTHMMSIGYMILPLMTLIIYLIKFLFLLYAL